MRIDELESELLAEALEGPRMPPLRGGGASGRDAESSRTTRTIAQGVRTC